MLIAIDASRANKDNKTGVEWYSWQIIQELKKITPEHRVILYANEKLKGELGDLPVNWQEKNLRWPPKYLWTQIRLWWELLIHPPEILFVPAHTIPFLPIRKKTRVFVTVHDVGFKRFPKVYKKIQFWYHDLTMRKIRRRADVIITISNFSKREIANLYDVAPEKIEVVYPGYDAKKYNLEAVADGARASSANILEQYKIAKPYILYVGRIEKKKNIGNIIRAFGILKSKFENLQLVLIGAAGNIFDQTKQIIKNGKLETEIIMPGYVAEENLPAIIAGAEIFLFPTLYEGFGLPILQAMACGTPVVASECNPHQEVAGNAAAFANPYEPLEIAKVADRILSVREYRGELVAKGLARVKEFSWRKTAEEILGLFDSVNK